MPLLWSNADANAPVLVLAHGSGTPMDAPFLHDFAAACVTQGVTVCRFEFAYMAGRRDDGKRRPPPKADKLIEELGMVVRHIRSEIQIRSEPRIRSQTGAHLFLGGKSMGGRVAAMACAQDGPFAKDPTIHGVVSLGYPLHPTGKSDQLRLDPLVQSQKPLCICQGERDPFGRKAEFEALTLPNHIEMTWLTDGDHDFGTPGHSPVNRSDNIVAAAKAVASFMKKVS